MRAAVMLTSLTCSLLAFAVIVLTVSDASARFYYDSANIGSHTTPSRRPDPAQYAAMRHTLVRNEESRQMGADIALNERERLANDIIMTLKTKEYEEGLITPHLFSPAQHIFSVLEQISASPLFQHLALMPKGGVLHAHDTALCSTDFLIQLSYRDNLWACQRAGALLLAGLRFAKTQPSSLPPLGNCTWTLLRQVRVERGAAVVDDYLRARLTMYPVEKFEDNNAAWEHFTSIFLLVDDILTYAPVWADYYYHALEEFAADGVQYVEVRSTLPTLYDLEGTNYTTVDVVRIYNETLTKFKLTHPDFIGSKVIYAPVRHVNTATMDEYIRTCVEIKRQYPDLVAGFDMVGQEELGRPLKDFIPQLLAMPDDIDFYFHAGETNFYGAAVDENLIDAVLLGTKRIGHGFALVKHPDVLDLVRQLDIAIEVNPISNQVLQLVTDYRNHPCAQLFADNYTVVISSDDPSFWRVSPLSHDFYIAFLGIAGAHADLRLLKQLALNSLHYSALDGVQTQEALRKWQTQWDVYIERVISGEVNAAHRRLETNLLF